MISITRHRVLAAQADGFVAEATGQVEAMARRPGFVGGRVARAVDDVQQWVVVTEWVDVGSYRRALGDVAVRVRAAGLVASALDGPGDPTGFEVLVSVDDSGAVTTTPSAASAAATPDRAGDPRADPDM